MENRNQMKNKKKNDIDGYDSQGGDRYGRRKREGSMPHHVEEELTQTSERRRKHAKYGHSSSGMISLTYFARCERLFPCLD